MGEFLRAEVAAGHRYLPVGPNVLRAFTFPFDEVRVLIVGQDPYPTPGHAVGLSFSVAPDVRPLPRSLANIFTEYSADLGYPPPANGDLTPWAQRGVMLLNRVLTVRPGTPGIAPGQGLGSGHRMCHPGVGGRGRADGGDPVGPRRRHAYARCSPRADVWRSSRRTPRRCRRAGDSSDRARSAGPTNCWPGWAPNRSTGDCPRHVSGISRGRPCRPSGRRCRR